MLITAVNPGEQIVVLPDWATRTIAKHGKLDDITDFSKMRQIFNNDQIVALDKFSDEGLNRVLGLPENNIQGMYSRSAGYIWCFPGEGGNNVKLNDADEYAWQRLNRIVNNHSYGNLSAQLCQDLIYAELESAGDVLTDISQCYSVYSVSKQLIILSVKPGIMGQHVSKKRKELRLAILRSVLGKLEAFYDKSKVAQSDWFSLYLTELESLGK